MTYLITGGSRGFGLEIAAAAIAEGRDTIIAARHATTVDDFRLSDESRCRRVDVDFTAPAAVPTLMQQAGAVDVLVLNAGSGFLAAVEDTEPETEHALFALLYHSPMALIRAVLPQMRARGSGHIVIIGAAASHGNYAGFSAYGAAKAALECAAEALRAELVTFGVKVSVVVPGPFRTGFIEHAPQRVSAPYANTVGRFATVLQRMNGKQPGDPARAAALIVQGISEGTLPARSPLGAYAVKKLRDRGALLQREADAFAEWAASADFSS